MSSDNTEKSTEKKKVDKDLTEELKQSFPASDPATVTRTPSDQRHVESKHVEEKKTGARDK